MFRSIALAVLLLLASPFAFSAAPIAISPSIGTTTVVPLQSFTTISGMTPESTGQAYDLGFVNAGGYVTYTFNIAQAGPYSVLLNYSQPTGSSTPTILVNGIQQASVTFSTTGSYASYGTAFPANVNLPAGQVTLEVYAPAAGFNIGGMSLQPTTFTSVSPVAAQGLVSVPLQDFSWLSGMLPDSNGQAYNLGYINTGGYVLYPLNVAKAGVYTLTLSYASPFSGGAANIVIDGINQNSVSFTNTGAWSTYVNGKSVSITLPAGQSNLEIYAQAGNFNLGGITIQSATTSTSTLIPASGLTAIPIQSYSVLAGMSPDSNGLAFDIGYVTAGGYVVYPLTVARAGMYSLTMNYSSPSGGTGVNVAINGTTQASASFGNTGFWSTYINAPAVSVSLPAGQVYLQIYAQNSGFNLGALSIQSAATASSTSIAAEGSTQIPLQNYDTISGMAPDSNGSSFDLGYITSGAYVTYPLVVAKAGTYALTLNYASPTGNTGANVLVNGSSQASVSFANTGAWSTYISAPVVLVTLPAGAVTLEILAQNSGFNLGGMTLAPKSTTVPLAYYVSNLGNDNNDGKTVATAFATLQKAANVVQPGYTVYVLTGIYQNTDYTSSAPYQNVLTITTSGTQAAPIVFRNYPGESPKIQFDSYYGIQIASTASYITLSGFEIQGIEQQVSEAYAQSAVYYDPLVNGTGISVAGSSTGDVIPTHIIIQNMNIHDCPESGIGIGYADYVTIQDNVVYNNAYWSPFAGSGISFLSMFDSDTNTSTYKNVIQRNVSYGNIEKISNLFAYGFITDGNGMILDSFDHSGTSYPPYAGKTLVANNLIYSNGGAGISTFSSSHVDVINNTSSSNNINMLFPLGAIDAYYSADMIIENNVMVGSPGKPVNLSEGSVNIVFDYNLYFGGNGPQITGVHDLTADPMFVAPQIGNYQLQTGSPAIGSGVAWPNVTTDLLGNARPGTNGIDRGAYQK